MKKLFALFIVLLLLKESGAQGYIISQSPYLETASCTPAFVNAFSCAVNPAAIAGCKGFAIGGYAERKFAIQGLDLALISMHFGGTRNGAGLFIKYFGNPAYNEMQAAINYGRDLGNIKVGASFSYNNYGISGFIRESVFAFSFYSVIKFSDKFYSSLRLASPSFAQFGTNGTKQKWIHGLGVAYQPSRVLCFSVDIEKAEDVPLLVKSALQFRSSGKFYLKAGLYTGGPQPFIGLGREFKNITTQFSFCYHPELGITPGILFSYQKTEEETAQ